MSAEPKLNIYTLPLFPLNSVLFPYVPLQLHVFEERYKAMISACIERNEPFGVVLIREGEEVGSPATPFDVGCVARILAVQRFEDGRMNLLAAGESRFRLLDYMEADLPYLLGRVEPVEDAPAAPDDAGLAALAEAITLAFTRYVTLLYARSGMPPPQLDLPDDPDALAFGVAAGALLPPEEKQRLLELTDLRARLEAEGDWLREQIMQMETLEALEARLAPDADSEAEAETETILAAPLQRTPEQWRRFQEEGRN